MASASQITVYQIGGSFCQRGKTCEHVNARAALHDASARVGMFASRIPFSQLSKNGSSPPSEKPFYIIPDPFGANFVANEYI